MALWCGPLKYKQRSNFDIVYIWLHIKIDMWQPSHLLYVRGNILNGYEKFEAI